MIRRRHKAAPNESPVMQEIHRRRRRSLRFRPLVDPSGGGSALLDRRLLLSVAPLSVVPPHHAGHVPPAAHPAARQKAVHRTSQRVPPAAEIKKQYNQFYSDFQTVEASYVRSLNQQGTGTVTAVTTLTANYTSGSASMQVADAGVFGPEGVFASPVTATAMVGSVPVGTFILTGSSGNLLAINAAQSSAISLSSGTTLTAQVTTTTASSAQAIFPTYITTSAQQLAINLVAYFNSLPFKLPRMFAFPHQSQRSGALPQYVYQLVAGAGPTSLERSLMAISLPQTPGSDLQIYDAAVKAAIQGSRTQMLSGVQQIFAGKLQVVPINASSISNSTSTTSSNSTSTTSSSSSTSGTGSTSTGGA